MVIFSVTDLIVSSLRSNADNMNTIIGYGLAQEGLEAVRNIRDSNWLLGADITGRVSAKDNVPWGKDLPKLAGSIECYALTYGNLEPASLGVVTITDVAQLSDSIPWKLSDIKKDNNNECINDDKTLLVKATDQTLGDVRYEASGQFASPSGATNFSQFHRYIKIEAFNQAAPGSNTIIAGVSRPNKYRVTSVVTWNEGTREGNVTLETEITDWKEST